MVAWVVGNWKQNPATIGEVNQLVKQLSGIDEKLLDACQVMVAPSHVHIAQVAHQLAPTKKLWICAQDVCQNGQLTGAFTGDCSAGQLADAGARWSIIGHSERRSYHHENNETLCQKIQHCMVQHLGVILCVGETADDKQQQQTFARLEEQLSVIVKVMESFGDDVALWQRFTQNFMIAYEPVWAIGTGNIPTLDDINGIHQYIKKTVDEMLQSHLSTHNIDVQRVKIPVLYGGSVNAQNASYLQTSKLIDGVLVGGASLKIDEFVAIIEAFSGKMP